MGFDIILDLLVIVCLIATILFAVRLNKKLSVIYKSREELQTFLDQFTKSMEKADAGVKDLKGIGESVFKTAQKQMEIATALKDDLLFLNERGEDLADRLDAAISSARELSTSSSVSMEPLKPKNDDDEDQPELVRHLLNVR